MNYSQAMLTGQGVQLGEVMSEGLKVTGVGLLIVFAVLVILMLVLYLFKVIFYKDPKQSQAAPVEVAPVAPTETAVSQEDEDELIAVLTAAVAASLNTSTYNLKIKSYRRVTNTNPAWNKAGVNETISNRIF